MGGTIECTSKVNEGSEFKFTFKLQKKDISNSNITNNANAAVESGQI